jgi:hypothetical protein
MARTHSFRIVILSGGGVVPGERSLLVGVQAKDLFSLRDAAELQGPFPNQHLVNNPETKIAP